MADWTEKYRPSTLAEVRGNDKSRDALLEWATTWDDHRDAAVLHGSPGVGKTSAAHALASDLGWAVIELNASDDRTADVIARVAGEAAKSGTLDAGGGGRRLVILDEADNLHRHADRGGAGAITEVIKTANQPVVLIANDFYELSRGLRNACREIEFRDVSARSIRPVLRDICRQEGIDYEDEALAALAEANSGDLRGAINDLQAIAEPSTLLTVEDVVTGERDRTRGIFGFLDDVFKDADAEAALRASYDVDETPDDLIGWIEDNVPKDYAGAELAAAYDALADADKWLGRVRATQNYGYWRYATDAMTAGVAAARTDPKGGWTRYGPPSFWRKLGAARGRRSTRDDVARGIAQRSGTGLGTARRAVLPYLARMTHHCRNRELTVAMAAAYDLDAGEVAFVTGSGEDTNKVQSIVEDARDRREAAVEAHSAGAFEGASRRRDDDGAAPADEASADPQATVVGGGSAGSESADDEDDGQSGLDEFY